MAERALQPSSQDYVHNLFITSIVALGGQLFGIYAEISLQLVL
jgi:hypothetical protein